MFWRIARAVKVDDFRYNLYKAYDELNIFFGLNSLSLNPCFSVVLISILVFIISFMISGILNNIPGLKKYIVWNLVKIIFLYTFKCAAKIYFSKYFFCGEIFF